MSVYTFGITVSQTGQTHVLRVKQRHTHTHTQSPMCALRCVYTQTPTHLCLLMQLLSCSVDVSYHGERHAVDLMFVFGLVLSEGTVPKTEETESEMMTLSMTRNSRSGDGWSEKRGVWKQEQKTPSGKLHRRCQHTCSFKC